MNYTDILKALNSASAFDLYRLRAAIDNVLDQPGWLLAVQSRLRVGQPVEYFSVQANRAKRGQILGMRRKQVEVLDTEQQERWLIPYAAINLDGADVEIREEPEHGLGRNSVAIGDIVGFVDKNHQQRSGRIIRLNDKTVTLLVGHQQWRVAYCFLHRIVDGVAQATTGRDLSLIAGEAEIVDDEHSEN